MKRLRLNLIALLVMICSGIAWAAPCPADEPQATTVTPPTNLKGYVPGYLLEHQDPKYPGLARFARVQGLVIIKAVITVDGKLASIQPVCGENMLIKSTVKAIKTWRYKPFEVEGKPVEVNTIIRTDFALIKKD